MKKFLIMSLILVVSTAFAQVEDDGDGFENALVGKEIVMPQQGKSGSFRVKVSEELAEMAELGSNTIEGSLDPLDSGEQGAYKDGEEPYLNDLERVQVYYSDQNRGFHLNVDSKNTGVRSHFRAVGETQVAGDITAYDKNTKEKATLHLQSGMDGQATGTVRDTSGTVRANISITENEGIARDPNGKVLMHSKNDGDSVSLYADLPGMKMNISDKGDEFQGTMETIEKGVKRRIKIENDSMEETFIDAKSGKTLYRFVGNKEVGKIYSGSGHLIAEIKNDGSDEDSDDDFDDDLGDDVDDESLFDDENVTVYDKKALAEYEQFSDMMDGEDDEE